MYLARDSSNFYIWYSSIEEFVVRKGVETIVRNMLGTYDKGKLSYSQDVKQNIQFCDPSEKERNF